eukprot:CAMPEP_0118632198 /NCGR_PEP_ID=MMETSP0785-20121206/312_1 /TAXON_ID=91992 /ORGANISM="Bolidomonas pacifica, Strain CCMP 1866" /LENGTH=59 /DNA_ID=CAMNT_0006522943 /DNA_START=220 /DNA_END=399 /DNA_ORIENTATION=-
MKDSAEKRFRDFCDIPNTCRAFGEEVTGSFTAKSASLREDGGANLLPTQIDRLPNNVAA